MPESNIMIVGKSGVGKSSLLNLLIEPAPHKEHVPATKTPSSPFLIVDSHGIQDAPTDFTKSDKTIDAAIRKANVILFVVDYWSHRDRDNQMIARRLHDLGTPVILVINKVDTAPPNAPAEDFSDLGFQNSVRISVRDRLNIQTLLDLIVQVTGDHSHAEYLLIRAYITDVTPSDEMVTGLVDLYRALNALHIDNGGSGLKVVDWQIFIRESVPAEVP